MRLWSLHPRHLDAKGLVALWREGLLARAVLSGATVGYRHHPQLERFRKYADPIAALDGYLGEVLKEAESRGYEFDSSKIQPRGRNRAQPLRNGQLEHEWQHLLGKLYARDRKRWAALRHVRPECHPAFRLVPGGIEEWERTG